MTTTLPIEILCRDGVLLRQLTRKGNKHLYEHFRGGTAAGYEVIQAEQGYCGSLGALGRTFYPLDGRLPKPFEDYNARATDADNVELPIDIASDKELEFHPIANLFPMLDEGRLAELAESIKARGLLHKITLFDGKILDGRNRYKACLLAEVTNSAARRRAYWSSEILDAELDAIADAGDALLFRDHIERVLHPRQDLETAINTALDRIWELQDEADAKEADGIASEIDDMLAGLNRLFARLNALQCELLKISRYGADDEAAC
jgi:hypothetical protein